MKVTNTRQLSAYMKDVRETKKLSQSKVASKVGIRQDTVSSFELSPDSTKLETFFKILSALNLELDIKPRNESGSSNSGWKEEWWWRLCMYIWMVIG
ncbi:helix-turn-helix domain-containing protein [Providencia rettgeri]|nr:helix-turn-helix domain-containing protein [Providencia rettgeri]